MAKTSPLFTSLEMSNALTSSLDAHIRNKLRERILSFIEPDINSAIDAAIDTFRAEIQQYRDVTLPGDILKIIVEHKGTK